jgi:hypothetical protein
MRPNGVGAQRNPPLPSDKEAGYAFANPRYELISYKRGTTLGTEAHEPQYGSG